MTSIDDLDIDQLLIDEFESQAVQVRASAVTGFEVRRAARHRARITMASTAAAVALVTAGVTAGSQLVQPADERESGPAASLAPTALPTAAPVDASTRATLTKEAATISTAERLDLRDGIVTRKEYLVAFERMRSCIRAAGFETYTDKWDETNQVIHMSYPNSVDAAYQRCYAQEFALVDSTWQVYRANFGPDAEAMAKCLTARGKTPRLTLIEKYEQLSAIGLDAYQDCPGVTGEG